MAKAASPSEFEPEIVLLYCRQSLAAETKPVEAPRPGPGFTARLVPLPCSSKVEVGHMLKIVENGADGLLLVACPDGACQFLVGNQRAEKRLEMVRGMLGQLGLEAGRVALARGSDLSLDGLLALGAGLAKEVAALGPSPVKGPVPGKKGRKKKPKA
jgi:coenzyme F420-reducing hydrogenase delta subunit